jgi:hypothetical protein
LRSKVAIDRVKADKNYKQLTEEMKKLERIDRNSKIADIPKKYVKSISDRRMEAEKQERLEKDFENKFVVRHRRTKSPAASVRIDRHPKPLNVIYESASTLYHQRTMSPVAPITTD